jgi:hypothetical protein
MTKEDSCIMHRVKRPASTPEGFSLSQVQSRMTHENFGDEPKAKTKKSRKEKPDFQLNHIGGPLGEGFKIND